MKKIILCLTLVSMISINPANTQTIVNQGSKPKLNISERPYSFVVGANIGPVFTHSAFCTFELGMNYRIAKKLYLYPNIQFMGGGYFRNINSNEDYNLEYTFITQFGASMKYYYHANNLKLLYLKGGIALNSFMKDDDTVIQIKSRGLSSEFLLGYDIPIFNAACSIEFGFKLIPAYVDTQEYLSRYSGPPLMENVHHNLGGPVLNAKVTF